MEVDRKDAIRVVTEHSAESGAYRRQFVIWLGVGSGAGIAALLTFAEKYDDPVKVLHVLLMSLIGFIFGVGSAAASVLFASLRDAATAWHHAAAHNREEFGDTIRKTPQWLSAPQRLADELNTERDATIVKHGIEHAQAEAQWARRTLWARAHGVAISVAILGVGVGATYPVALIALYSSQLQKMLGPSELAAKGSSMCSPRVGSAPSGSSTSAGTAQPARLQSQLRGNGDRAHPH